MPVITCKSEKVKLERNEKVLQGSEMDVLARPLRRSGI